MFILTPMKIHYLLIVFLVFNNLLVFAQVTSERTLNIILICGQSNAAGNAVKSTVVKSQFTCLDAVNFTQAGDANLALTGRSTFTLNSFLISSYTKHGMEFGLAEALYKSGLTDLFIVKYAWGGSWIYLWSKTHPSIYEGRSNLYTNAIEFLNIKIAEMKNLGYKKFKFQGLVWLQGETDALTTVRADAYRTQLNSLTTNFKNDIAASFNISNKEIPIYLVQPATYADRTKYELPEDEAKVINALNSYASNNALAKFIATNDLTGYVDPIHFNTASQNEIGVRVAEKMRIVSKTNTVTSDNNISMYSTDNGICINGATGEVAHFYNIYGQLIKAVEINSDTQKISIAKGLYIIAFNNFNTKILI